MTDAQLEADRLPERLRSRATNSSNPSGVSKAPCAAGDTQSMPAGTPRVAAISGVTLAPGRMPPCPGLAPWLSLISIILTCAVAA
jgi:hypothetical protein